MEKMDDYTSFRITVPEAFQEVFSHLYFAANHTKQVISKTLYPSYQTIMIFNFGAKASLVSRQGATIEMDKCLLLGPIKQAFDYTLPVGSEILVANFKDDAFYRFFGSAALPGNIPFDPDGLLDENCFTSLWHELQEIGTVAEKADYVFRFCQPYLKDRSSTFEPIAHFREQDNAQSPIKVIAEESSRTQRSIQLNHKKYLGYSAKEISRYHRFLKATGLIRDWASEGTKPDWHDIISQCGYYDQSQFIHDFKHFINLSPNQYLRFQQDICFAEPG
ncbi:AraC family transcriptional regulator [Flavobacterium humi]|uniref:AraC family transcriptional regulator n=2 Tax=Flavobacterium humi TaxID=2562683 RepID=A0A4Z0LD40_9FLAO|nr:AraC family transcriptional regulator [Flavobacterium humi]